MGAYVYIWAFRVAAQHRDAFEQAYGAGGAWTALFAEADGYLGTSLLADRTVPGRYLTIDRWRDEAAYRAFRERCGERYAALDIACDGLTEHEEALGSYVEC